MSGAQNVWIPFLNKVGLRQMSRIAAIIQRVWTIAMWCDVCSIQSSKKVSAFPIHGERHPAYGRHAALTDMTNIGSQTLLVVKESAITSDGHFWEQSPRVARPFVSARAPCRHALDGHWGPHALLAAQKRPSLVMAILGTPCHDSRGHLSH